MTNDPRPPPMAKPTCPSDQPDPCGGQSLRRHLSRHDGRRHRGAEPEPDRRPGRPHRPGRGRRSLRPPRAALVPRQGQRHADGR
ncbi:MAG: hypothetical protein WDN45_10175 [Caulobacteraceae bacterium]